MKDDPEFYRPDEPAVLITTNDLYLELGVVNEPPAAQAEAVREWLARNEPNRLLRLSLELDGLVAPHARSAA